MSLVQPAHGIRRPLTFGWDPRRWWLVTVEAGILVGRITVYQDGGVTSSVWEGFGVIPQVTSAKLYIFQKMCEPSL